VDVLVGQLPSLLALRDEDRSAIPLLEHDSGADRRQNELATAFNEFHVSAGD